LVIESAADRSKLLATITIMASYDALMFVLAHLSDPHLGPLPTPRLAELIGKRATGFLNWRRKRQLIHRGDVLARIVADLKAQAADHITVTGDLVNISLAGEYPPARAWLASLGSPRDVTLVPGNHDVYVRAAAHHPQFYWGEYMRGDDAGETTFPFVRRRGPLALIGLSTAAPTAPFLATGRLGREQIARLAEALDRSNREGLFRVVLIHHPPVSKPARHFKRLLDGADFRAALARHGAELVIHGHDHAHALIELEGPQRRIPVVGAPSASQAPRGEHDCGGYNLYRIEGHEGRWRCEAIWRSLARDGDAIVETKRTVLGD
jgi:3',5'-cyclic AMP phosphodiesterase CpdA